VVATVALHALLLAVYVARHGHDVSVLVCVGQERVGQPPFEAVRAGLGRFGYDGQFYYAIARAPWRRHPASLECPARQFRILYPALCWLLSGGQARLLLWICPVVNLAAIGLLSWLGARLALAYGMSAWWGFLLPMAVNAGLPALRNLTDPLSTLAILGLLFTWLRNGRAWALTLWAAAVVFSREQNVIILVLLAGAAVWRRRFDVLAGLSVVLLLLGAWFTALYIAYQQWPLMPRQGNIDVPLAGILRLCTHLRGATGSRSTLLMNGACLAHLLLQIGLALYLVRYRGDGAVTAITLAAAGLAVLGGPAIYEHTFGYTRVFACLPLGICLQAIQARRAGPLLLLAPAALWPWLAAIRA
jgi:hypothetical protein